MPTEAVNEWVERVLSVDIPLPKADPDAIRPAAQAWRTASDAVDKQIAALQTALRNTDDDDLHEIAEFGLNGITGGFKVRLMAALMSAEKADAHALQTLKQIVPGFRDHLESDERVAACDNNPFGVQVQVRSTLVPALDQLLRSLG